MLIVTATQWNMMMHEGKLVTEASDLELRPGEWPQFIGIVNEAGEGFLFNRSTPITHDSEFGGYRYYTRNGLELVVFND